MKKLFFSILGLLASGYLAWADNENGVKVSGEVTVDVETCQISINQGDLIHLRADGVDLTASITSKYHYDPENPFGSHSTYAYEFESVPAGDYTISYEAIVYAICCYDYITVSYSESITVGAEEVVKNIKATHDPSHVTVEIKPLGASGILEGVTVTCQAENSEKTETQVTVARGQYNTVSPAQFYCDTTPFYNFTLSKGGYQDTTIKIKALTSHNSRYGISVGKVKQDAISVLMKEAQVDKVKLKGNILVKDAVDAKLNGLYLIAFWYDKIFSAEIKNGIYQFDSLIPVGEIVYQLSSTEYDRWQPIVPTQNWRFESNASDTLHYLLTGEDQATETNDLTLVRVGVDISGTLVDSVILAPEVPSITQVMVKISNDTYKDSLETTAPMFSFSGIKDGSYTLTFSKNGYITRTEQITIDMSAIKADSTVQLGNIALTPEELDYTFSGSVYYLNKTNRIPVGGAKVVRYADKDCTVKLDSVICKPDGSWTLDTKCILHKTYYFKAFHESIEEQEEPAFSSASRGESVDILCDLIVPDSLLKISNCKASVIPGEKLQVLLTWDWPQTLKDGESDYQLSNIQIFRCVKDESTADTFNITLSNTLPEPSFVDSASQYALKKGKTYTYRFRMKYSKPNKSVYVNAPDNLTVFFAPDSARVTINVNDAAMGTVSGGDTYAFGTEATLEAIPNQGYHFVKWNDEETDNPRTLTVTCDTTFTAVFAINTFTLSVSVNDPAWGNVSQSGEGTYAFGTEATLEATPNTGYHFVKWDDENTDNPRTLTVTQDTTFTAEFAPNIYTVMVHSNDASMGTVSGGRDYAFGSSATLEAVPSMGYHFVKWNDGNTENPRMQTVTCDTAFTAEFAINIYTVTVNVNDASMGRVSGGGEYVFGSQATLRAIPNDGYHFVKWDDGNTDNPRTLTISDDITLTAIFAKDEAAPSDPTDPTNPSDPTDPGNPGGPGEPGGTTANEAALAAAPFAYVQGRTVYLSDNLGEVEAFTATGQRVYRGFDRCFTLPQSGVYVLRVVADGRRSKVMVK